MSRLPADDRARELVERVRVLLAGRQLREVRMFGAVAVMVDGAMAVAVNNDGRLLVRVDPAESPQLLENPGASRAEMGSGRSMGDGWIRVQATAVCSEAALSEWVEAATRYLVGRGRSSRRGVAPS